jgi:hypothetical protein
MPEMAVYPSWYDKFRAELSVKYPWLDLHFKYVYIDLGEEAPIWIYPVIYGPEEYE